jgi:hypothetical protein
MTTYLTDLDTAAEFAIRLSHLDEFTERFGSTGLWVKAYLADNATPDSTYWVVAGHDLESLHHVASFDFNYTLGDMTLDLRRLGFANSFTIEESPASDDERLITWIIRGLVAGLHL